MYDRKTECSCIRRENWLMYASQATHSYIKPEKGTGIAIRAIRDFNNDIFGMQKRMCQRAFAVK